MRLINKLKQSTYSLLERQQADSFNASAGILKIRKGTVVKIAAGCRLEHITGGQWRHVCPSDMNAPLDPFQKDGDKEKPYSTFEEGVVVVGEIGVSKIRVIFLPTPKAEPKKDGPAKPTAPSVIATLGAAYISREVVRFYFLFLRKNAGTEPQSSSASAV